MKVLLLSTFCRSYSMYMFTGRIFVHTYIIHHDMRALSFLRILHCQQNLQQQHVLLVLSRSGTQISLIILLNAFTNYVTFYFLIIPMLLIFTNYVTFYFLEFYNYSHVTYFLSLTPSHPLPIILPRATRRVLLFCSGCKEGLEAPLSLDSL